MALILTRKIDETLVLTTPAGELIEVTVIGVRGNRVTFRTVANVPLKAARVWSVFVNHTMPITTPSGEQIEFLVMGVKGNQVRIGTTASQRVTIDREEIYLRKVAEAAAA